MNLTVSKSVFDYLYHHLADIHSRKMKIINSFAIDFDEYMRMLDFIKTYIHQFERFLGDVGVSGAKNALPFVIYNCVVGLMSTQGNETWMCCVTLPKEESESVWLIPGVTMIPCNTTSAFELMHKRCGEKVDIERDGIMRNYTIKSIEPNPYIPLGRQEI
jgi:hypothetical protein